MFYLNTQKWIELTSSDNNKMVAALALFCKYKTTESAQTDWANLRIIINDGAKSKGFEMTTKSSINTS